MHMVKGSERLIENILIATRCDLVRVVLLKTVLWISSSYRPCIPDMNFYFPYEIAMRLCYKSFLSPNYMLLLLWFNTHL